MSGSEPVDADRVAMRSSEIPSEVDAILQSTAFVDIHTHLFPASFGRLGLSGIDELLTYHYLEAELFRVSDVTPEQYWQLAPAARAEAIWQALFVARAPISEAARGVVASLDALGLDASSASLTPIREAYAARSVEARIDAALRLAGVSEVVMTNDPLDPDEVACWDAHAAPDRRFHAALRIDRVLNDWVAHVPALSAQGYRVDAAVGGTSLAEVRRFLDAWIARMRPRYMAVSLPDTFTYPAADVRTVLLDGAILPACADHRLPLSLMIGVRRQVNPALRLAGDASGRADLRALEALCARWLQNRFLVSVLSRENQHELCVYARKFANLLPFGCWWFLNNGSLVEEITRMRLEMLGTSFIPQHSDARVLEQLIYKWRNTRRSVGRVLADSFRTMADDGRPVTRADIRADVERLFRGNFERFAPAVQP